MIPLGPFRLHEPIGEGGMGTVWSGEHRVDGVPVAVKLLGAGKGWGPVARQLLHNEVRAVAALHHPGVVMLLDAGETSTESAEASGGRIQAQTPYLVMELCSGGTLWEHRGRLPWSLLQPLLLTLLDALAHAHARGVIHRDLKPGNVLIGNEGDLRPGPKLTDFGIARLDAVEIFHEGTFAGSPSYAPPEQLMGRTRLVGPWTDLYALGVLTWDLVCASTPWRGLGAEVACREKLSGTFPEWEPVIPMPEGLQQWIERLLAPRPADRPAYAADAAWSLRRLEAPANLGWAPSAPLPALGAVGQQSGTEVVPFFDGTRLEATDAHTWLDPAPISQLAEAPLTITVDEDWWGDLGLRGTTDPAAPRPGASDRPPLLDDWRRRDPPEPPMKLVGAGLALYSLRTLPMVDREPERDAIWSALHDVARTGVARCVLVRGPSGVGKSRVVGWMAERAHELGVAGTLVARHGPTHGRTDGVGAMIARRLNLDGLTDDACREALAALLEGLGDRSDWLQAGLTGLVLPYSDEGRRLRALPPQERLAVVVRYIELLGRDRPVLLWLDDLQWGAEAVALARALLSGRRVRRHPVLVIGTVRDPDVLPGSATARGLAALSADDGTETLSIEPLDAEDQAELVGELLRLDPDLRDEVVRRTEGNPLFAVQLVGDWVRRGILVAAPSGFERAEGEDASLPDDIHTLWTARFEEVLGGRPAGERRAVELAAALGERVERAEWQALCAEAGVGGVADLPGLLAARGLAWSEARQWAFVHAMARESVERAAREAGRWADANAAVARMLQGVPGPDAAARRARHLFEAGSLDAAARDLRAAIEAWLPSRQIAAASDAIALRARCLEQVDAEDPRRLQNDLYELQSARQRSEGMDPAALEALVERADALGLVSLQLEIRRELGVVLRAVSRLDESVKVLGAVVALADESSSELALGRALPALGWSLLQAGQQAEARRVLRRAATVCAKTEPRGMAVAYGALAMSYRRERRLSDAARYAGRALEVAEQLGDTFLVAESMCQMAAIHADAEAPEEARPLLKKARRLHERLGAVSSLIALHSQEGHVLSLLGRLEAAEETLHSGIELQMDGGGWLLALLRANLGKVQLKRRRWAAARATLELAVDGFAGSGRGELAALTRLLRIRALVGEGRERVVVAAVQGAEGESYRRFDDETWRELGQAAAGARERGWAVADRIAALASAYKETTAG